MGPWAGRAGQPYCPDARVKLFWFPHTSRLPGLRAGWGTGVGLAVLGPGTQGKTMPRQTQGIGVEK